MSLECSECERDLRGGHSGGCSRHPINKKNHPGYKQVKALRKFIGERDDHHSLCRSRQGHACDCYARAKEAAHCSLDDLIEALEDVVV